MNNYHRRYEECENIERKFLDSIPDDKLLPLLQKGKNLLDIMEEIEDLFGDKYTDEEYIFNYLDKYDFEDYIGKRYPDIKINHIVPEEQLIVDNASGYWVKGYPTVCSICGGDAPLVKDTDIEYVCETPLICPHCKSIMIINKEN